MSFFIDTGEQSQEISFKTDLPPDIASILTTVKQKSKQIAKRDNFAISNDLVNNFTKDLATILENKRKRSTKFDTNIVLRDVDDKSTDKVNELLKKSVINKPNFDVLRKVPQHNKSEKKLKRARRYAREKTKGKNWFNMPATEITDEVKHDLEILQMRSVLDPKHFYKKNDLKVLPKYFQIGKVMDSPLDYYNRCTKKERKRTIVDELLADAEFNKYNKRKYVEIIEERRKTNYKAYQRAKKLKRKNK